MTVLRVSQGEGTASTHLLLFTVDIYSTTSRVPGDNPFFPPFKSLNYDSVDAHQGISLLRRAVVI